MPVEIRKLVIKATIENKKSGDQSTQQINGTTMNWQAKEMLVQECVEQVLAILEREKER